MQLHECYDGFGMIVCERRTTRWNLPASNHLGAVVARCLPMFSSSRREGFGGRRWSCDLCLRLFYYLPRISKNARSRMGPPNTNGGWLGTWVMTPFFVNSVFRARSFWWCTWRRVCPPQLSLSFSVFDDLLAIEWEGYVIITTHFFYPWPIAKSVAWFLC